MALSKISIYPFQPESMRPNSLIVVLGRRRSGKSSVVLSLLYHLRHTFDVVFAFCPTSDMAQKFQKIIPDCFVWNETQSEEMLNKMLRVFSDLLANNKSRRGAIVSDDCSFDGKFFRTIAAREMAYNGRNENFTWIVTCQGDVDLPKHIRAQIDYVFLMKDNFKTTKENLFKYYAGIFPSQNDFNLTFDQVTQNFKALVIDRTETTNEINKCVFYFAATLFNELPKFRVSRDVYFKLDKMYNIAYKKDRVENHSKITIKEKET